MIESKFVDVAGVRTHYLESAPQDGKRGEPLLLLHGGQAGAFAAGEDWRPVLQPLGKHFRVLAIDKAGCGQSDNPKDDAGYMLGGTVEHARGFLKALGIERAHVAGHSRGGYGAVRLALEYPAMVATLINVASGTLMGGPTPYAEWAEKMRAMTDPRERIRFSYAVNSYSDAHIDEQLVETMYAAITSERFKAAHKRAGELMKPFAKAMADETAEARARIAKGGITMPTLVVWGFNDPSAVYATKGVPAIELFLSSVKASEAHVINRAGHYSYREQPRAFADALTSFIQAYR